MRHLVLTNLFETVRCRLIACRCRLAREISVHRLHFVRFALNRVLQILGIAANQARELRLFRKVLKPFDIGSFLEQGG